MITNTLTWSANTETDLAGYNVYRGIDASPMVKINAALVAKPAVKYVDITAEVDGNYIYNITAVDTAGNESLHSANVNKVVNVVPPQAPTGLSVV
jgi:fibronectin type 3 domain-containing protein